MASMDDLVSALYGRKKEIYQGNPWLQTGAQLAQQNYYTPSASNASNLGAALLSGFGGGAMQAYGRNQADQEYANESSALGKALTLQGPDLDNELETNQTLAPYKPLILLANQQQQAAAQSKADSLQTQKELYDYQMQTKAKYQKPAVVKPSNLEKEYEFLAKTRGPEVAQQYLNSKGGVVPASTAAAEGEDPEDLANVLGKVPFKHTSDRNGAIKELDLLQKTKAATTQIDKRWGELEKLSQVEGWDPTGKDAARYQGLLLTVFPAMKPLLGQISDSDMRFLQEMAPRRTDRQETKEDKKIRFKEFLQQRAQTPYLDVTLGAGRMEKQRGKYLQDLSQPQAPADPMAASGYRIVIDPNTGKMAKVRR